jgi:hypothetical protein
MIQTLRNIGITSPLLYTAGFASIGLSVAAWWASRNIESKGLDRADRWGIFVGTWAPTFFALGNAMRLEEDMGPEMPHGKLQQMKERAKEKMLVGHSD